MKSSLYTKRLNRMLVLVFINKTDEHYNLLWKRLGIDYG